MLYVGNQTTWAAKLTEPFDYALERHFDAFEWFPDKKPGAGWDETDLDAPARQCIREAARAQGMRLSVHARWQANPLAPDGPWLLRKDVDLARDLGAVLLNLHLSHEQGMAAFVEAMRPLIQRTAEAGLQLSIENTPQHAPEDFNDLFGQLRRVKSLDLGHVGMCLDLGHANLCSATLNDYLGFVDRLDPTIPIIHLHLHENWGDADSHLPLFTGPAAQNDAGVRGLLDRLHGRQFSGSAILEQWPNPPTLLDQARDRLLEIWQHQGKKPQPPRPRHPASVALTRPAERGGTVSGISFVDELAAGDRQARSWREKLEFARGLLAQDTRPITTDDLVVLAVYLRFLGTGEIGCEEDGRHFRPAHHARIAEQIRERLVSLNNEGNAFVLRKIYPWLPSSAADFRRPEPLTRIRDIAHRNDIDPELKREIKTTLQNKLHRCAGPEDLKTSAAILTRLTAPGASYSPAFVEQFRIFHEELKEFFNAQSLEARLQALAKAADPKCAQSIHSFLRQKDAQGLAERLEAFRALTTLREVLLAEDASQRSADNRDFLLADIGAEDFAFSLVSELINECERADEKAANDFRTEALILALKNLELSAIDPAECQALRNELQQWGRLSLAAGREELLRLKACLWRCRRLADDFGGRIAALFSTQAEKVGQALGVTQAAIRVFCESELRGHLIFQIAKLLSALLRQIRERLQAPAWDVLVSGRAVGKLLVFESLAERSRQAPEPIILLLKSAAGDEEIPPSVTGVVLGHELPHLSHLSVRARQAGVVFVTCEEPAQFQRLGKFAGQRLSLLATPDAVHWEPAAEPLPSDSGRKVCPLRLPPARLSAAPPWIPLAQATVETSGGKAAGMRRLAEVSRGASAGFETPPGLVVPFGVMEAALAETPDLRVEYERLLKELNHSTGQVGSIVQRLQGILQRLAVPEAIVAEVARQFGPEAQLIVRSSANGEDLEQLAGAGLYRSVINVSSKTVAAAIRSVWSSLWTERAVLSRREADIPHEQVHMAVLIQQLLHPDLSFVLHTVNPIDQDDREVYAEIVVGLGETLVSAASRGTPYRLTGDKRSGAVVTLAFANFSRAARPQRDGGITHQTLDYSNVELSRDSQARQKLGRSLAEVGALVEQAFGKPQDIEGAIVKDRIYLVQSRPQQGLQKGEGKRGGKVRERSE